MCGVVVNNRKFDLAVGPALTALTLIALEVLSRYAVRIPNPPIIYFTAVVYSAYRGGLGAGIISAAMSLAYALYFFSSPGEFMAYTPDNAIRMLVLAIFTPAITLMTGMLKMKHDRAIRERDATIKELHRALDELNTMRGILPICSMCRKIRDDDGSWKGIEAYIGGHSETRFSHGYCPDCAQKAMTDAAKTLG